MSSFAVLAFFVWKSAMAWRAIFVYFPLVGISIDSVRPLYSILISCLVYIIGYFCFVELSEIVIGAVLVWRVLVVEFLRSSNNSVMLALLARWAV